MSSGPYVYEKLAQLQDQDRNVSHAQGLCWLLGTSVPPPGRCLLLDGMEGSKRILRVGFFVG